MTAKQFEKKVSGVLDGYRHYNVVSHKTWKKGDQLFLSVKLGPDLLRSEPWGVFGVYDKDGKLIRSSCGKFREYLFTWILMERIEAGCEKPKDQCWQRRT